MKYKVNTETLQRINSVEAGFRQLERDFPNCFETKNMPSRHWRKRFLKLGAMQRKLCQVIGYSPRYDYELDESPRTMGTMV